VRSLAADLATGRPAELTPVVTDNGSPLKIRCSRRKNVA